MMSAAPSNHEHFVRDLTAMLEVLLGIRHSEENRPGQALQAAFALLAHEVRRLVPQASPTESGGPQLSVLLERLSQAELLTVRHRALYYACHDLIDILVHRYIKGDALVREEAALYVQDRLQRDGFHRIASFDPTKGASFKTYMWQVVSRLLIDFIRAHRSDVRRRREYGSLVEDETGAGWERGGSVESGMIEQQMREIVSAVLAQEGANIGAIRSIRERLRAHLNLTSHERLFLRALFQYDMSIDEVRQLPGFRMEKAQAWRFYYGLLERLMESFKDAGVLLAMRGLIGTADPQMTLSIGSTAMSVAVTKIQCVKQLDADCSGCYASYNGSTAFGVIQESFARLKKRLAPWLSAINPTTLVADELLAADTQRWYSDKPASFRIEGIAEEFPVSQGQQAALRRRYAAKDAASASYKDSTVDPDAGANSHDR